MRNGHASMGRKRFYTCAVIGNFVCLLATASASEPTLQESIDFIRTKVQGRSCEYRTGPPTDYRTKRTSGYTITLLENKTILVKETVKERRFRDPGEGMVFVRKETNFEDGDFVYVSNEEIWSSNWTVKVRLADLSTDVETNIPNEAARDVTARDIVVNCAKPDCLEYKVTNRKKRTIQIAASFEKDPDIDSESRLLNRQKSTSDYIFFTICDQKDAEKIKKALIHAIRISGGKDGLF